jgi:hypothetical protein
MRPITRVAEAATGAGKNPCKTTVVSLGTSGSTASSAAMPRITAYVHGEADTSQHRLEGHFFLCKRPRRARAPAGYRRKLWKARKAGLRLPAADTTPDCQPERRRSSRMRNHTSMSIRPVFRATANA